MGFLRRHSQPTIDEFAQLMMKTLRQVGDDRTANFEAEELRLVFTRDGERAGRMHLSNLYAEYCATKRSKRSAMLRRACIGLIREFAIPNDIADVMPDILPTVRVRSTEEEMRLDQVIAGGEWEPFASLPLSEHLEICLVYDMPERMEFLSRSAEIGLYFSWDFASLVQPYSRRHVHDQRNFSALRTAAAT